MWNEPSITAVDTAWFDQARALRRPLTGTYSFDRLPGLITHLLTGSGDPDPAMLIGDLANQPYDRVVLAFLDAFGWSSFLSALPRSALLERALHQGVITRLTSQFPSTTTAHITTLHYGLPVGQTGIYEWFCYYPPLDRLISPLTFSFAEDREPNTLLSDPTVREADFAPGPTLFQQLAAHGVTSFAAQKRDIFGTGSARLAYAGSNWLPYLDAASGATMLGAALATVPGKAYGFYYYELIDKAAHKAGPSARKTGKRVDQGLAHLEQHLLPALEALPGRSLLLITADHGQTDFHPDRVLYLNESIPNIAPLIRRGAGGRLLVPAGSSRDMFLHAAPGETEALYALLTNHAPLTDHAAVYRVDDLIAAGLFGAVTDEFRRRVGDVVVLPASGYGVWWRDPAHYKRQTQDFRGHHGGLSPAEMDIPLIALATGR